MLSDTFNGLFGLCASSIQLSILVSCVKNPFLSQMGMEPHWSVIINQATCTEREWKRWANMLDKNQVDYRAYRTDSLGSLSQILSTLVEQNQRHFLFAGGDGTLHHGGNELIRKAGNASQMITFGVLPSGTGNDWVRTFGIKADQLIACLKNGKAVPLHLIHLQWPDGRERYAFNMVGGALDAAVVQSLSTATIQIPGSIKYPIALLKTLMKPHQWTGRFLIDGVNYEGNWLTLQAGFGKYCGGGMYVLPHAGEDKAGLLLMKPKSLWRLLISLPKLYNGKVAHQKEAVALSFSEIDIIPSGQPIPLEADGEFLGTSPLKLSVRHGILQRLSSE